MEYHLRAFVGAVHRRHVVSLCPLGRNRCGFLLNNGPMAILTVLCSADDTIARKVNSSDASAFAKICGCFPSQGKLTVPLLNEYVLTAGTHFTNSKNKSMGCHLARHRVPLLHRGRLGWHRRVQGTLPSQVDGYTLSFFFKFGLGVFAHFAGVCVL